MAQHLPRPQTHLGPVAPGNTAAVGVLGPVVGGPLVDRKDLVEEYRMAHLLLEKKYIDAKF